MVIPSIGIKLTFRCLRRHPGWRRARLCQMNLPHPTCARSATSGSVTRLHDSTLTSERSWTLRFAWSSISPFVASSSSVPSGRSSPRPTYLPCGGTSGMWQIQFLYFSCFAVSQAPLRDSFRAAVSVQLRACPPTPPPELRQAEAHRLGSASGMTGQRCAMPSDARKQRSATLAWNARRTHRKALNPRNANTTRTGRKPAQRRASRANAEREQRTCSRQNAASTARRATSEGRCACTEKRRFAR